MVPDDPLGYRLALIEAFRRRGIFAPGVPHLSEECLAWPTAGSDPGHDIGWLVEPLRRHTDWMRYEGDRLRIFKGARGAAARLHAQPTEKPDDALFRFGEL